MSAHLHDHCNIVDYPIVLFSEEKINVNFSLARLLYTVNWFSFDSLLFVFQHTSNIVLTVWLSHRITSHVCISFKYTNIQSGLRASFDSVHFCIVQSFNFSTLLLTLSFVLKSFVRMHTMCKWKRKTAICLIFNFKHS